MKSTIRHTCLACALLLGATTSTRANTTYVSGSGNAWGTSGAGGSTAAQPGDTHLEFSAGDVVNNPPEAAYIDAAGTATYGSLQARFDAGASTGSNNIGIAGAGGITAGFTDTLTFFNPSLAPGAAMQLNITTLLHTAISAVGPFGDQFGYHYDDHFQFGIFIDHALPTLNTVDRLDTFGVLDQVFSDSGAFTIQNGGTYDIFGELNVSATVGGFLNFGFLDQGFVPGSPAEGRLYDSAEGPGTMAGATVTFDAGDGAIITSMSGHDYNSAGNSGSPTVPDTSPTFGLLGLGLGGLVLSRRRLLRASAA